MKTLQVLNFRNLYGSGLTESVPALCSSLAGLGVEVSLYAPRARPDWRDQPFSLHVHLVRRGLRWLDLNPRMYTDLSSAAGDADLIHSHDMWTMPGVFASWAACRHGCPSVISPRGTLAPAARRFSAWKKQLMWHTLRASGVKQAACMHATAEHEYQDIRRAGFRGPVAIIPNGVQVPAIHEPPPTNCQRRVMLYLARIHPIKGIDVLLSAWQQLQHRFPDWELQIAGQDDGGHVAALKQLAVRLQLARVTFTGPAFGEAKYRAYSQAELYVLPTRSENFGITVAEALAHGVPAVVTRAAPWSGLADNQCGWWIRSGVAPLVDCLSSVLQQSRAELAAHGARGRAWMRRDFSLESTGERMLQTYQWLLGGGTPPGFVEVSQSTKICA